MTPELQEALDQLGAYIESTNFSEELKDKFTELILAIEREPTKDNVQLLADLLKQMAQTDMGTVKALAEALKKF